MPNGVNNKIELPRWQSHKKVWADKIVEVSSCKQSQSEYDGGFPRSFVWRLACGEFISVSEALKTRGGDYPLGGYYVRYEDGYESWSPAKAFEEGYARTFEEGYTRIPEREISYPKLWVVIGNPQFLHIKERNWDADELLSRWLSKESAIQTAEEMVGYICTYAEVYELIGVVRVESKKYIELPEGELQPSRVLT